MEFSFSTSQGYVFIASFFLTVALFYVVLVFAFQKKTSYMFFIFLCLFHMTKIVIRPDQNFLVLNATTLDFFATYKHIPFSLAGISLVGFMVYEFALERKKAILLAFVVLTLVFYVFKIPSFGLILFYSLGIAIYALRKDKIGGVYAIVGLLLFGLFTRLEFIQNLGVAYYLGVIAFIMSMTLLVGQRIKATIRHQREAQLKSINLENQLLKSTIQPHFITNSLTSLQELIETNPKEANHFIESLAEEFRLFSVMAEKKLVPIDQEISLCKTHLNIMSHRKQGTYQLQTDEIDGSEMVPPGIFHTLIENGLTHGFRSKSSGIFKLKKRSNGDHISYHFSNTGEVSPQDESNSTGGTGFKYIKNRLLENYGNNWSFQSEVIDGNYQVNIKVPK